MIYLLYFFPYQLRIIIFIFLCILYLFISEWVKNGQLCFFLVYNQTKHVDFSKFSLELLNYRSIKQCILILILMQCYTIA